MRTHLFPLRLRTVGTALMMICVLSMAAVVSHQAIVVSKSAMSPSPEKSLRTLPLHFEANQGQFAGSVRFVTRRPDLALALKSDEMLLRFPTAGSDGAATGQEQFRIRLLGAQADAEADGLSPASGRVNYFYGNRPELWRTNIPACRQVRFRGIYPGIDVVHYGNGDQLEYDFILSPGANHRLIRLGFDGARSVSLDADGNLLLEAAAGRLQLKKPVAYQEIGGRRQQVAAHYLIDSRREVSFDTGPYDPQLPLVIDPVLSYSAVIGNTTVYSMAADSTGNTYLFGLTALVDFPTTPGTHRPERTRISSAAEMFVAKLNPAGTEFVYATYIGGNDYSYPQKIVVDAAGQAYLFGFTAAEDFPVTPGAYQRSFAGPGQVGSGLGGDTFLTRLSADGASLIYSTYFGGKANDQPFGMAVDGSGQAYLLGQTFSSDFPTTPGAVQATIAGGSFVTKFNDTGSGLIYSTLLKVIPGQTQKDHGNAIAVDAGGNAFVTGASDRGVFVTGLNQGGTAYLFRTTLSSSLNYQDQGLGIAVDAGGQVWVTGQTTGSGFPVSADAAQRNFGGGSFDAFLAAVGRSGSLSTATFLGGSGEDIGRAITLDSSGNPIIAGTTSSPNFPITPGVLQTRAAFTGNSSYDWDAFVAKFSAGRSLFWSTYLGGDGPEDIGDIAAGSAGQVFVAGATGNLSGAIRDLRFPVTPGALNLWQADIALSAGFMACIDETKNASADLSLMLTSSGDFFPNTRNALVFKVTNVGTTPTTGYTKIICRPPPELTYIAAGGRDWECPKNFLQFGNLICNYARPIAPGETVTLMAEFNVSRSASGPLNFSARVVNAGDINPGNDNGAFEATVKTGCPDATFGSYNEFVSSQGGTFNTALRATGPCSATAISNAYWIRINSAAADAISYVVDPNLAFESREGSITAGGASFRIAQSARTGTPATIISAASYSAAGLAADSIAALFGAGLATTTQTASSLPLPKELAGTRVSLRDYTGVEREAALFFVSPLQINLLIPPGLAQGFATVIVRNGGEIVASGRLTIQSTAPALFAADASGQGLAAALALRVRADGAQVFEPVARFDPAQQKFVAVPLELSNSSEQVFLVLFGTGIRGRSALSAVTAQIGGADCAATYAGPQGGFAGLDQVNVRLPASLAGQGEGTVSVIVDGRSANPVKVWIK